MSVYNITAHLEDGKVHIAWSLGPTDEAFMLKLVRQSPAHYDEIYLSTRITRYIDEPPDNATYGYQVHEYNNRGKELSKTGLYNINIPRAKDQTLQRVDRLEEEFLILQKRIEKLERGPDLIQAPPFAPPIPGHGSFPPPYGDFPHGQQLPKIIVDNGAKNINVKNAGQ